jgi:hypothetical protein
MNKIQYLASKQYSHSAYGDKKRRSSPSDHAERNYGSPHDYIASSGKFSEQVPDLRASLSSGSDLVDDRKSPNSNIRPIVFGKSSASTSHRNSPSSKSNLVLGSPVDERRKKRRLQDAPDLYYCATHGDGDHTTQECKNRKHGSDNRRYCETHGFNTSHDTNRCMNPRNGANSTNSISDCKDSIYFCTTHGSNKSHSTQDCKRPRKK